MCLVVEITAAAMGVSVRSVRNIHINWNMCTAYPSKAVCSTMCAFKTSCIRQRSYLPCGSYIFFPKRISDTLRSVGNGEGRMFVPRGWNCLWWVLCETSFSYKNKDGQQFMYGRTDLHSGTKTHILKKITKWRRQNKIIIWIEHR